jgi:hypothetical protein
MARTKNQNKDSTTVSHYTNEYFMTDITDTQIATVTEDIALKTA